LTSNSFSGDVGRREKRKRGRGDDILSCSHRDRAECVLEGGEGEGWRLDEPCSTLWTRDVCRKRKRKAAFDSTGGLPALKGEGGDDGLLAGFPHRRPQEEGKKEGTYCLLSPSQSEGRRRKGGGEGRSCFLFFLLFLIFLLWEVERKEKGEEAVH